ncbi:B12-binding domain-containing radical SAM protein [Candidatus Woesearchaeota archaeon]|nr:B12-binding domain-containing radical SAM protein [Candidatus Woesearchaeota archaeon]
MKVLILNPASKFTKNVVRDLIYGCWCKGKRIAGAQAPPLNLLYVASVLKHSGHEVRLLDAPGEQRSVDYVRKLARGFEVVVISTSTMSYNEDAEILADLKKDNPRLKTIVFGSHPTFMPNYCLSKNSVDIIIRREPEFIIRDVVNNLSTEKWMNVKGIGYRKNGRIVLNELYPFIDNLDELPIPDRTLLPKKIDYFNPIVKRTPFTTAMTSRGCPARCTFCNVPDFYGNVRYRTAKSVIDEIKQCVRLGYKEIWFRDETFTFYKDRNKKICKWLIDNKVDLTWICNARVGTMNKQDMALFKRAGCHMIKYGVESGVQKILDNVHKGIKVDMTQKNFKWANEVGIDTHAHVMLGMPGETKQTIKKTIQFVKDIKPTTATFGICTPYAGTRLFKFVARKDPGLKDGSQIDLRGLHTSGYYNRYYTSLHPKELEKSVKVAYRKFYFRPSYILNWLTKIKSGDELKRVILAGTNVFSFGMGKE